MRETSSAIAGPMAASTPATDSSLRPRPDAMREGEDDESVFAAMQAGARGSLLQGVNQRDIACRARRRERRADPRALARPAGVDVLRSSARTARTHAELQVAGWAEAIIRARDAGLGR